MYQNQKIGKPNNLKFFASRKTADFQHSFNAIAAIITTPERLIW